MTLLLTFIQKAIGQGVAILFGASGEIVTEKSGNLNLGIPGIMYMGGIAGLMGAFFYEKSTETPNGAIGVLVSLLCSLIASALGGLIYSFLTITLRANQNVVGLALTTFGVGFGNFFGGSISKLAGGVGQISVQTTAAAYRATIPGLSKIPVIGTLFFSYGFLTYLSVIVAVVMTYFLKKTRKGLNLRAVGESPATADAAGINVSKYKYAATVTGAAIAGLGGLYFVMEYLGGTWSNNGFGDRGWLAIALVILALWNPDHAIWGSFVFGGLYILYIYLPGLNRATQELVKMLPYVVTIIVLIITSKRNKQENQPDKAVYTITDKGNDYFNRLMNDISNYDVSLYLDFNIIITNLDLVDDEQKKILVSNIKSKILELKELLNERQSHRQHIPNVGKQMFKQQLALVETLEKWIIDFENSLKGQN